MIRLSIAAALALGLSACGGGGNGIGGILGGLNPSGPSCNAGTQVQLANPQPGQAGVSTTIGQITIVANGNNNTLYNTYNQWYLTLTGNGFGNVIQGSNLNLVSYPSGPHPYPSDFYFSSNIGQLPSGTTWQVNLVQQGTGSVCPLNSFST
jgi:hypothetical protein